MKEQFSPAESLGLIQLMIEKTRANISENRFYFLMWGWLSFLAILTQFVLKVVVEYRHHYMVWLLVIPAVIITIIKSARTARAQKVRTYAGDNMGYLWSGIGISFFVLSYIINLRGGQGWMNAYPFFILFYGLGTFVSGRILQFTPLVIGGIFNWALAIVCAYVAFDYQLLIAATAILTSYIIPGHMIKSATHAN